MPTTRSLSLIALSLAFLLVSAPASALFIASDGIPAPSLDYAIDGDTTDTQVRAENDGSSFTVRVGLLPGVPISGYDLTISWDDSELLLTGVTNVFNPGSIAFSSPLGGDPMGERVADISFVSVSSADLFDLTFQVLSAVDDGMQDLLVFRDLVNNGSGVSGTLSFIPADASAGLSVVPIPEPGTGALLAVGMLALRGRRRG